MRTYTFPMTPEQWADADLSYYTLCRIVDVCGLAIYSHLRSYERITGTLTTDDLGNFLSADLKFIR